MSRFVRKAVMAVLASLVLTGVVAAPPASAASPSVFLRLCNHTSSWKYMAVAGLNQHGQWTENNNPVGDLGNGSCAAYSSRHRFRTNQWVKIYHHEQRSKLRERHSMCHISSSARDGSWVRCTIR